jgi:hypothetical protein
MSRRSLINALGLGAIAGVLPFPHRPIRAASDDTFVIVDGWVLKRSDLE